MDGFGCAKGLKTYHLQPALKKQSAVSYNSRRNGRGFGCAKELKT